MLKISNNDIVETVTVDMCARAHGMKGTDEDGVETPIMKPTRLLTNSPDVAKAVAARCPNRTTPKAHDHMQLVGGKAKQAQVYPRQFCQAM